MRPGAGYALPVLVQDRADVWALLGALLLQPSMSLLWSLAQAPSWPDDRQRVLVAAWQGLTQSARSLGAEAVQREHGALFYAVGIPLVDPYASRYVGRSLMDRTLARLRADLQALGQARRPRAAHTEDHLGALCETMRLLIAGTEGLPRQPVPVQQRFFAAHLVPWTGACLQDIRQARGANFYAALATFFEAFMEHECLALELDTALLPEFHDAHLAVPA